MGHIRPIAFSSNFQKNLSVKGLIIDDLLIFYSLELTILFESSSSRVLKAE